MEFDFKNDKIVLITGPNGSGKSTIFDCIPYTFYGVTPKELKGDDVVNNVTGKDCYTYVEFDIDDDHYKCERYCKYKRLGNTAILYKNEEPIKKGHKEVVAEIERILLPQKLFMNTLLFGQKVKTFFTDLTDSEQKEIFRRVLQLDDYLLYYDEVNKRLKGLEEDVTKFTNQKHVQEGFLEELQKQIENVRSDRANFYLKKQNDLEILNNELSNLNNQLSEYSTRYEKFGDSLESEKDQLLEQERVFKSQLSAAQDKLENEILSIRSRKKAKESELIAAATEARSKETQIANKMIDELKGDLYNRTHDLEDEVNKIKIELNRLSYVSNVNNNRISTLQKDRESLVKGVDDEICPLCKQKIQTYTVNEIKEKIAEIDRNLELLAADIERIKDEVKSLMSKKDELTEKIESVKIEIKEKMRSIEEEYNNTIAGLNTRLKEKLTKLEDIETKYIEKAKMNFQSSSDVIRQNIENLQPRIEKLNTKIEMRQKFLNLFNETKAKVNSLIENIDKKRKEVYDDTLLNSQIEKEKEVKETIRSLSESLSIIDSRYNVLRFWKTGFSMSGIPSMLIDEAIPFMNRRIMEYLDSIGGRYIVSFDTLGENKSGEIRDKITIRVLDTVTKANMRKQLSGGQTRIIDIATILTLSDLQNIVQNTKTNIILLDEIFDSLDDKNIAYVSNLLRSLSKGRSTNIISHRAIDQIDCDEQLQLF